MIHQLQNFIHQLHLPILLIIGIVTFLGFYFGKVMKYIRLPSIIGFMIIGVLMGPSLFGILSEELQYSLAFITEIALGFVAISIGLELSLSSLKQQGRSIIFVIIAESLMAFILVTASVFLFARLNPKMSAFALPLALIFGSIAPASAPAGTVAIIKEYKARGPLTKALYSVVGFDDGLGIIIFGFASAIAKSILNSQTGIEVSFLQMLLVPLKEVFFSLIIGVVTGVIFTFLIRMLKFKKDYFILTFCTVLIVIGLCHILHLSLILTNMIVGIIVVNSLENSIVHKIGEELSEVMPLVFILFFILAGANLHISALPSLGILGVIYVFARSLGLVGGSMLGSVIGGADEKIRKYLGLGILSQAGVAIGLALIVKQEFVGLGADQAGSIIGTTVITSITATCIIFEIIGPILTKIALEKAGEINT
ncbi:MAG: cation:proton antiporter [Spirochaetes bacterium]|nr:cation:proton antiporter [Spirochaetota bacterium]